MIKYLIINADDFGLTKEINKGIIKAHKNGVVTSTSLMIDAAFAEEAVDLTNICPNLSIGLHFTLPNEDEEDIKIIKKELDRQFNRFLNLVGKKPTHLDSHHHIHLRDDLFCLFTAFAQKHKIPLRSKNSKAKYVGDFYGQWYDEGESKSLFKCISLKYLEKILSNLSGPITELGCHPGYFSKSLRDCYNIERVKELETLLNPKVLKILKDKNIKQINFYSLGEIK